MKGLAKYGFAPKLLDAVGFPKIAEGLLNRLLDDALELILFAGSKMLVGLGFANILVLGPQHALDAQGSDETFVLFIPFMAVLLLNLNGFELPASFLERNKPVSPERLFGFCGTVPKLNGLSLSILFLGLLPLRG
jgi:hypothetical protein